MDLFHFDLKGYDLCVGDSKIEQTEQKLLRLLVENRGRTADPWRPCRPDPEQMAQEYVKCFVCYDQASEDSLVHRNTLKPSMESVIITGDKKMNKTVL